MRGGQPRPVGFTPRRGRGLGSYERVLTRLGLGPVAGIDEAGRGACAGPLVVAAVMLRPARVPQLTGLADSKILTVKARNAAYHDIMDAALDWSVVVIPSADIDRMGLHVCNVAGMRRALAGLRPLPGYVLTDGFAVRGLGTPALAMWKGDQVAACVAAASVIAKVTRDAIMCDLDGEYPGYGFARHKGYSTPSHMKALDSLGPCGQHRRSFVNVRGRLVPAEGPLPDDVGMDEAGQGLEPWDPDLGPANSGAANSCDWPGNGHNGPIVDAIEEHGWPTAGVAAMARGA